MQTSPDIKELATALAKAQKAIKSASKDATNPFFKTKYADLSSVWEAAREPLTSNGLSVVQTTEPMEGGFLLVTRLFHESGQWIQSALPILPPKFDMQVLGSAMTYARRYSLAAIAGIAPGDDDDGEATKSVPPVTKPPERKVRPRPEEITLIQSLLHQLGKNWEQEDVQKRFAELTHKKNSNEWEGADILKIVQSLTQALEKTKKEGETN